MGIGNMTRRLGMNQASKGKPKTETKTLNEAMGADDVRAEKRPQKKERVEAVVSDLTAQVRQLVKDFASVEAQLKTLNEWRDELKERATKMSREHGVDDFTGPEGKVQVIVKAASQTFDKAKARQYLTEAQYESCLKLGKTPDPTVKFVPAGK